MDEACKEKGAFICRHGTFQFEVMSFGLMNFQAAFQRMMDRILLRVNSFRCCVDDAVNFSGNEEEHLKHLENIFVVLKEKVLCLRIKKVSFMQSSVELQDHIVDQYGFAWTKRRYRKSNRRSCTRRRRSCALSWISIILPTIYARFCEYV